MPRGVNDYDTAELQGRNVANSNSVNIVSPGLITDGLRICYDAGNIISYSGAGTVLQDISGNLNHATLVSGPTFDSVNGGRILCASSQYINTNFDPVIARFTISAWLQRTASTYWAVMFGGADAFSNSQGWFVYQRSAADCTVALGGTDVALTTTVSDTSTVSLITVVFGEPGVSGNVKIYQNSDLKATSGVLGLTNSMTANKLLLNSRHGNGGTGVTDTRFGNWYSVFYYNRALTPVEVNQNFNATRARFGI